MLRPMHYVSRSRLPCGIPAANVVTIVRPAEPSPFVSIIIPCYAASTSQLELLDETLRTVDAQDYTHFEVVVVDDGSPLGIEPVARLHRATRTIRQPNGGSALARNTGIEASRGSLLVFLDADDHLLPGALSTGAGHLSMRQEVGFVVGGREEMTFGGQTVPWGVPRVPRTSDLYNTLLGFDWYIIPPSSAMFRRDVVDAVGGFREPWGADDLDFYLRVARSFKAFCYDTPAVTRYRRYSASSSRDGARMLHSIRTVYERQRSVVLGDPAAEAAFERGLAQLTEIFRDCLVENVVDRVRASDWQRALRSARMLATESPRRLGQALGRLVMAPVSTSS
jgi:glycosyltransferase involved in cell wall biosynthesis